MAISYEEVFNLARQLPKADQQRLTRDLEVEKKLHNMSDSAPVTREQLLVLLQEKRQAGLFNLVPDSFHEQLSSSLDVSEEELNAYMAEINSQWKKKLGL